MNTDKNYFSEAKINYSESDANVEVEFNGEKMPLSETATAIEEEMNDLRNDLEIKVEGSLNGKEMDSEEFAERYVDGFYESNGRYTVDISEEGDISISDNFNSVADAETLEQIASDFESMVVDVGLNDIEADIENLEDKDFESMKVEVADQINNEYENVDQYDLSEKIDQALEKVLEESSYQKINLSNEEITEEVNRKVINKIKERTKY